MRDKMDERFEEEAAKCNSLATLREAAKRSPGFQDTALDSIAHLKCLLTSLTERLELKGKKFTTFSAANEADIEELWKSVLQVDPSLNKEEKITKRNLQSKKDLVAYLKRCCIQRHYSFQIKKCGSDVCNLCKPLRMSKEAFSKVHIFQILSLEKMVTIRNSMKSLAQIQVKIIDLHCERLRKERKLFPL